MDLRCKVLRAAGPHELESSINRFLDSVDRDREVQIEEITQSEGPHGITVTVWYSLIEEVNDDERLRHLLAERPV